ncbi:MAG: FapA family protein [Oscillospiraceae bacterium]|nr:FapA family protein [Oscillospiraceae bacterium]
MMETTSGNPAPPEYTPAGAAVSVMVSPDGMRADVCLTPPEEGGSLVTETMIWEALAAKKVVYGVDEGRVGQLAREPVYHMDIQIAAGEPAVHGESAVIKILIRTEKDIRPKELDDGSVDYKDLGVIQVVRKDDLLCEKTPATTGESGMNVFGAVMPAKPGKDIPMPAGKNTVASEDKLQLLAACDGHADIVNRKIQVMNTFTVHGSVSNSTGNINFVGNVVVEGNVLTGFAVQATGNVTINGTVEGAVVEAGGNIIIKEGVNGFSKGLVKAGGYIKSKYIQSGIVQAGGDIEASFIFHSKVQSGGSVFLIGSRGTVVGGHVTALKSVTTLLAGGRSSYVPTTLEAGNDPATLARSREIPKEIEKNARESGALLRNIQLLNEHKKAGRITPDRLETLQRSVSAYQMMAQRAAELEEELEVIQEAIAASESGTVNISGTAFPGVAIVIGAERMVLETKYDRCTFIRGESGVSMSPLR